MSCRNCKECVVAVQDADATPSDELAYVCRGGVPKPLRRIFPHVFSFRERARLASIPRIISPSVLSSRRPPHPGGITEHSPVVEDPGFAAHARTHPEGVPERVAPGIENRR